MDWYCLDCGNYEKSVAGHWAWLYCPATPAGRAGLLKHSSGTNASSAAMNAARTGQQQAQNAAVGNTPMQLNEKLKVPHDLDMFGACLLCGLVGTPGTVGGYYFLYSCPAPDDDLPDLSAAYAGLDTASGWRHGYCTRCACELTPAMDGEGATECMNCSRIKTGDAE